MRRAQESFLPSDPDWGERFPGKGELVFILMPRVFYFSPADTFGHSVSTGIRERGVGGNWRGGKRCGQKQVETDRQAERRGKRESGKLTSRARCTQGTKRLDSPRWKSWLAGLPPLLLHETVYFDSDVRSHRRTKKKTYTLTLPKRCEECRDHWLSKGRRSWSLWRSERAEAIDALSKRVQGEREEGLGSTVEDVLQKKQAPAQETSE